MCVQNFFHSVYFDVPACVGALSLDTQLEDSYHG